MRQGDAPNLFKLFFNAVIAATLTQLPKSGVRMLYSLGDELVGNRKKMRRCSGFLIKCAFYGMYTEYISQHYVAIGIVYTWSRDPVKVL